MEAPLKDKEILSQKECWAICGGRSTWEELKAAYPRLLVPFRKVGTKEQYWREVIMTTLKAAQVDGKLREDCVKSS